jgi:sugar phosphate isomerase/epimerase
MNNFTRKKYPFKLGTTSYILPDDILPNVKYLTPIVDDIELVLFESPDYSNIPSTADVKQFRDYAVQNGCGYTVHLPIDRKAGSGDPAERKQFCDAAMSIIERTSMLEPRAWVVHCEGITSDASPLQVLSWQQRSLDTVQLLTEIVGDPSGIVVENLSYPAEWNFDIVKKSKCKYCLDVGHLWLRGDKNWEDLCLKMLTNTNVVHLHGVCDGKDHVSLRRGSEELLLRFLKLLSSVQYCGIVTLEIFSQNDLSESLDIFGKIWDQI